MHFTVCLIVSVAILFLGIIFSFIRAFDKSKTRILSAFQFFSVAVFLSAAVLFFPIYSGIFKNDDLNIVKTVLLSIHNTIRLFIVDGEFDIISDNIKTAEKFVSDAYSAFAAFLFVAAPVLTFGAVFSLFKNAFSYQRYLFGYGKDVYVFSELNEKSLALAKNLVKNKKKRLIVFTDVFEKDEEKSYELIQMAKGMNAICLKNDIVAVNFKPHSKRKETNFLLIGDDDTENIEQYIWLIDHYKNREKTRIYIFSKSTESELLLNSLDKGKIRTRRINDAESLIFRNLYSSGYHLFDEAIQYGGEKIISAVIIGMGSYGTEITKALSWFCQMDGYRLRINTFDINKNSEDKFKAQCPELLDGRYNKKFDDGGEAQYDITVNSCVDVNGYSFIEKLLSIGEISYVFVSLGSDEQNIMTACKIREYLEAAGLHPRIEAVLYSTKKKKALKTATNYKGDSIDIEYIGDVDNSYNEDIILNSGLEKTALERHLRWGNEDDFWSYEYYYRSSVASTIHRKMKQYCGIAGIDKPKEERTESETLAIRKLEHRRWNAYMRSEGYTYGEVRNNIAKTHPCLVTYDKLSDDEKEKDDD